MKNGMIVFDGVVHPHDFRAEVMVHDDARAVRGAVEGFMGLTDRRGPLSSRIAFDAPPEHDWANKVLFQDSVTDFAMAQTVPLFGLFKDGLSPARRTYELAQSNTDRFLFCGGVDPLSQGVPAALEDMHRQVEEWGAVSFKFYQTQTTKSSWRADDEELAYPLYERAQELGIKMVQFHKGLPLGREPVENLRPNDLQRAAYDFPELNFAMHHIGDPYIDETINIAARFPNVFLILPLWFNQYFLQPMEMMHRLGKALLYTGDERICYGTDAFIWPQLQAYIDLWSTLEMPQELQEGYGYPALTEDTKRNVFGLNMARGLGIDLEAKYAALPIT